MKNIFNQIIWQFNFSTSDQLKAIAKAAGKKRIILGTSESESKFIGLKEAVCLTQKDNLFLNLDHGKDLKYIKKAIDIGYDMVHFDGSSLGFKENIKKTQEIVDYAHKKKVLVEGEIDPISSKMTDPKKALLFLKETGIDSLAIAIGNKHGKEKVKIDFSRIKEIKELTNLPLVLHGGSGVSNDDLRKAIKNGISKININTELRMIWKESFKKSLKKKSVKPYELLSKGQEGIEKKVKEYLSIV